MLQKICLFEFEANERIILKYVLHAVINNRFILIEFICLHLFGVSEPELTEEPPLMNPKNHKLLWLIFLYAITQLRIILFPP